MSCRPLARAVDHQSVNLETRGPLATGEGRRRSPVQDLEAQPVAVHRHILVVDDVAANLVAIEAALTSLRRPIVTATSGQQALAHLLEKDFSLVLLDVQMPGMDGLETASLIRGRERTKHLPIIFVTAHQDQSVVRRAY